MFKVVELSKSVQTKKILKGVNFEVSRGEVAIFLGGSGVGKSTLLRILNNLESYDSGVFFLDGVMLNLSTVNRNHTVGMVFQHFNLFENLSVENNIIFTLIHCKNIDKKEAKNSTAQLLKRYGLEDYAKVNVANLSGGQRQRLAIARTLAVNPAIICLDEPTSALDPRLTNQVAQYIKELTAENRIVLLTTHDMKLLEQLEGRIFLMEEGSIVESTSRSAYKDQPDSYPKLQTFLKGE